MSPTLAIFQPNLAGNLAYTSKLKRKPEDYLKVSSISFLL